MKLIDAELEQLSKAAIIERLKVAETQLDAIGQAALGVAAPPRTHIPDGELVEFVRALFNSGAGLAAENAQLRAMLKRYL